MRTILGILVLGLAATGCSAAGSFCEDEMACTGGNDADQDACVAMLAAGEEAAAAYECEDQWQRDFECEQEKSTCVDDGTGERRFTTREGADDKCHDEHDALDSCIRAASALDE